MGRIVVNIMPTADAPDAEGHEALPRAVELGYGEFTRIRQGRRFVLSAPGEVTEELLARARALGDALAPEHHEVAGVHAEGATITVGDYDDDWDAYDAGIGAVAPIPEGAGRREVRRTAHYDVDLARVTDTSSTGVYTGEDD
ncbi:hypothetical protein ACF3NS_06455 [Arsenicicoccus cauae]|uniref:hypothetical protein n=1 Tax=Arsenicicoccus cauae TaxID=2663847 RepID=UPI00370DA505